jgi:hypothetical protein
MGFKSSVSCTFIVHFKPEAMYPVWSQSNEKRTHSITFRYTRESSGSVMSLVTTDQALHIRQLDLAILLGKAILSCSVRIPDTCSQICIYAAAFGNIYSKFGYTGESSPYSLSHVIIAPVQYISESQLALRHSTPYWVLQLEYAMRLTYSWHSYSFCLYLIKVLVHWTVLSTYPYYQSITAYMPITVAIKSV